MTGGWEPLEVEPLIPQNLKLIINKGGGGLSRKHAQQVKQQHRQTNMITCPGGGSGRFPDTLQS